MKKFIKILALVLVLEILVCLGNFVPVAAAGGISLNKDSGPMDTSVRITGSGFAAGETVDIVFEGDYYTEDIDSVTASSSGGFTRTFTIPECPGGDYNIIATGGTSGDDPSEVFTVLPEISLSKTSGGPGDKVTVTATGFGSDEEGITITFGGTVVVDDITADENGSWEEDFNVPAGSAADYEVDAYGDDTDESDVEEVVFSVKAVAAISLSRTSGAGGTAVTVTGTGFNPSEPGITVTFNGQPVGSTTTANTSGGWILNITIPQSPGGSYAIDAYGNTTAKATVPDLSFSISPTISLSRTSAPAGSSVTVTGGGFTAGESNITVTYDGTPVSSATSADDKGFWTASITIPPSPAGSHSIDAYGSSTSAAAVPNIPFAVGAGIAVNPGSGAAGTMITVTGSGFGANEANIQVTFDGKNLGQPVKADAGGGWTVTAPIPAAAAGNHIIDARGTTTTAAAIPDVAFTSTAGLSLNETSGVIGTSVTISGAGFAANESGITVTFDGKPQGTPVKADASGGWTTTFSIPAASGGTHSVDAFGATTAATSISDLPFTIKASVTSNKTSGASGSSVTISGTGFAANSNLRILYDDNPLNIGTVTTDSSGSFSKSVTIPKSTVGPHSIKVADAQNNGYSIDFIETTPPPVPNPLTPADGERIGEDTPTFKWASVSESSNIAYIFQIDTDPDFVHPVIQKSGIAGTRYTLTMTESEALSQGQYYWRIKAVDAAGNESSWSRPMLLNYGGMPTFLLILIIVLAIVVIGLLAYFLVIRPMLRKRKAQAALAQAPPAGPAPAPEIIIPEVVNAEYRALDTDEAGKRKALPWRLALPQAPEPAKGSKKLSNEDQARLKMIVEFAKSLPLAEPGNNPSWLIDLAENNTGNTASQALYEQLLKGEVELHYDPAWKKHPTFMDLEALLEGQPILQNLNSYIDTVNRISGEASHLLQEIYRDAVADATEDLLANNGWGFISSVYTDAMSWFQCKYMREPTERDYSTKSEPVAGNGETKFALYGEQNTPFSGQLVQAPGEKEAAELKALHLKLRRKYRNSDIARDVVSIIANLEVQRNRLQEDFSQFNRLNF